jgi:tol-pal system protein YbgF
MAARAEIRLQQLEAQMRNLTGKVEELDFKMTQAIGRMDTLVADLDRRFDALEGRGPAVGATAGQSISGGVAATATTDNTGAAGGSDGKKPGVLGYLNESDLRDIESGRREDQATTGVADTRQSSIPQATAAPPTTQAATGPVLPEGDAASRYKHAFSYLMRHDYDTAEIAFREFVDGHGDDPLAGNAMYWLGETYYVREMFAESAVTFAEGYERYPGSPKTADNLLKLSFSLARLNRVEDACVALAQLSDEFPNASSTIKRRALTEGRRIGCKG